VRWFFGLFEHLSIGDLESKIFCSGLTTLRDISEVVSLSVIRDNA